MNKDFSVSLGVPGERIILKDLTEWGTGDNPINRNSIALIAGVSKFDKDLGWMSLDPTEGFPQLSYDPLASNVERTEFSFDLEVDGYHRAIFIFAEVDDDSATTDGSVYYSTSDDKVFIKKDGVWVNVSLHQLFEESEILSDVYKDLGFSPLLEKSLDVIWQRYENDAFPAQGKDYKNFYVGYGMLVGAISSLRQANFAEYDRKIRLANRLVNRWK